MWNFVISETPVPEINCLSLSKFDRSLLLCYNYTCKEEENPMRKIKLDFTIPDAKSRQRFVSEYLKDNETEFSSRPLTPKELEFISNYILFGKDEDGKNGVQKKMYEIQTRNKAWQRKQDTSLDTIMEDQPHHLSKLTQSAPHFSKRQVFDREEALARATTPDQKSTYWQAH